MPVALAASALLTRLKRGEVRFRSALLPYCGTLLSSTSVTCVSTHLRENTVITLTNYKKLSECCKKKNNYRTISTVPVP